MKLTESKMPSGHNFISLSFLLAALSWIGPFSIDAYLPSLPSISSSLNASELEVQQTLTAFLLPFALMSLWHGAISDALGRRRLTLVCLALFSAASAGCAFAGSIGSLMLFRALQGVTAGAGMIVGRAIVRDLLDGAAAQRLMSHMTAVFAIAPVVAPVLGGWLEVWFGWHSVFLFLVLLSASLWLWSWRALPETLPREKRQPMHAVFLARSYWRVLTSPPFLLICGAMALSSSAFFIYILAAPVFLMKHLKVGETDFLWLFGPITAGLMIGAWLSGRCAGKITRFQTIFMGYAIMAISAAGNILLNILMPPGLPWSIVPIFFYAVGMSSTLPSVTLLALDLFPSQRGLAASCQAFIMTGANSITSAVVIPLIWDTPLTLASGMAVMLVGSAATALLYFRSAKELKHLAPQPSLSPSTE